MAWLAVLIGIPSAEYRGAISKRRLAGGNRAILGKPHECWPVELKTNNNRILFGHQFFDCQPESTN
jgi:hypothetical protein